MACVVWEADPETFQFRSVSPGAEELLGYPAADWLEPGFWVDRLHPEDRERTVAQCVAATRRGEDHRLEYRLVAADGSEIWVEDEVECSADALRGVMVDATTSRFLLENSSDVITILDANGVVQYEKLGIGLTPPRDSSNIHGWLFLRQASRRGRTIRGR